MQVLLIGADYDLTDFLRHASHTGEYDKAVAHDWPAALGIVGAESQDLIVKDPIPGFLRRWLGPSSRFVQRAATAMLIVGGDGQRDPSVAFGY